jgi:hypothetical protein
MKKHHLAWLAVTLLAACGANEAAPATAPDTANDSSTLSDTTTDAADTAADTRTKAEATTETAVDVPGETAPVDTALVDTAPVDAVPDTLPPDIADDTNCSNEICVSDAQDTRSAPLHKWWEGCGTPVCGPWQKKDGVPDCTTQKPGDPCVSGTASCDPHGNCNQLYVCADSDPKAIGCPKSQRAVKSAVRYLTPVDVERVRQQLLATKLATYRYTESGPQGPRHLGFIIDDQPQSPAVAANGERVDLYGYLSMAVATLQVQAKQIERLEQEVARLQESCNKK